MPNHSISLQQAKDMTKKFRDERENILDPEYRERDILPFCETFDREAFDELLALSDCTQIRIYFGMNEDYQVRSIIVAVDANDNDLLPPDTPDAIIVEEGRPCPITCPANPL